MGGGVRVIGRGWVGDRGAGPEFGAEGDGLEERDAESSGSKVGEGDKAEDGYIAGLAVKAGWG